MLKRALFYITCAVTLTCGTIYWKQIRISEINLTLPIQTKKTASSLDTLTASDLQVNAEEGQFYTKKAVIRKETIFCTSFRGVLESISFESDMGNIFCKNFHPETISLDGNIHISSPIHHQLCLADRAWIDCKEKKVSLDSKAPNRVLFQQDAMKMSSPALTIQENEIRASGDVRLFFEPKETEQFEKIFINLVPKK